MLTASNDTTARLWEADSGKLLITFRNQTGTVNDAVFSPDGRRVLTASYDKTARLWEADSGKHLATFQGHADTVWRAVFSLDGRRVLAAWLSSNKGTKSDIEIAPAERALDRFSSCFFEHVMQRSAPVL